MSETDKIVAIKRQIEAEWLGRPGIRGIDVGYKVRGGQLIRREICIRFFVEHKDAFEPEDQIPETIQGYPTDVIEVGAIGASADIARHRPIRGSISASANYSGLIGTLSAVTRDKSTLSLMALSASHVFAPDDNSTYPIIQPSNGDGGTSPADRIATVTTRRSRTGGSSGVGGAVGRDCAVAQLTSGTSVTNEIKGIGPLNGSSTVELGDVVKKIGRTSGLTFGEITGIDASVVVDYAGTIPTTTYYHQLSVGVLSPSEVFQQAGDSGALLLNTINEAVGLLFAGSVDELSAWATPIATVLTSLNIDLVLSERIENRSLISWNNHLERRNAALTASSAAGTMGVGNVINPHLAVPWRTTTGTASWLGCDIGAAREIAVVGLFGTNFTSAAFWRIRLSNLGVGQGDVWDTGLIEANVATGFRQAVYVLPSPVQARYVRIDFEDAAVEGDDGYFDIGVAWVGDAWQPSLNFAMGFLDGWADNSTVTKSRAGQSYVDKKPRYRVRQIVYDMVDETEIKEQAHEMERLAGVSENVLFIPEPFSTEINRDAMLGRFVQLTPSQMVGLRRWQKSLSMEERL